MKILYIGNFGPEFSTENEIRKALQSLNHDVICAQENSTSIELLSKLSEDIDLLLITGTWDSFGHEDFRSFIYQLANKGIPSATLHLDTFWPTKRDGRKWWLENMFQTSYIFTADGDWDDKWKLLGKNHIWLTPAVSHESVGLGKFTPEYSCDVAFVGSNGQGYHEEVWPYRKKLVDWLRQFCKDNNLRFKNPGGDEPKVERGQDLNNFYASAKVIVGDSLCVKEKQARYWSDRVPETTGRGGFLIMPEITELKKLYPEMPTYKWHNFDSLADKIKYYLENEDEREKNKLINYQTTKVLHTYQNRVQEIIRVINEDSKR